MIWGKSARHKIICMETNEKQLRQRILAADKRGYTYRWSAPVRAIVSHPKYGQAVVPCRSKLSAIMCAAEEWGVDYTRILTAEVWRYEC